MCLRLLLTNHYSYFDQLCTEFSKVVVMVVVEVEVVAVVVVVVVLLLLLVDQ